MKANIYPYKLEYHFPFVIAHTARTSTPNIYLQLIHNDHIAWGEAAFPPYVNENISTAIDLIKKIKWPDDPANMEIGDYIARLERENPGNTFALAAIDIALHNLKASITGISIRKQYGIRDHRKETSVTLGISSKEEMAEKIKMSPQATYHKLKVNQQEIGRIIEEYLQLSSKPFVIDANQGFYSRDTAKYWCDKLFDMGCSYMEQPFHKADLDSHLWVKQRSPLPIIADESYQRLADLPRVAQYFHGINVKLMKSAGIAESYLSLIKAREMGLKTIIGCMSESTVAVNAAWNLTPLADWVDLDGPLLIKNDPFAHNLPEDEIIPLLLKGERQERS